MRRKTTVSLLSALVVILSLGVGMSPGQESGSPKAVEKPKPAPAYHLDLTLNELENGKKINTRQYAMDLIAETTGPANGIVRDFTGRGKEIKIGTRVPIEADQGKLEYMDIGTRIWCRLLEEETGLSLDVRAEVSSLVPRSDTDIYHPASRDPIVRQIEIQASTAIAPGKLTSLGTVDDPDSKRQFQLEVTATKLR
jgi:hypothetical protein